MHNVGPSRKRPKNGWRQRSGKEMGETIQSEVDAATPKTFPGGPSKRRVKKGEKRKRNKGLRSRITMPREGGGGGL